MYVRTLFVLVRCGLDGIYVFIIRFILILGFLLLYLLFFFNDTATTEIYTLSLHDALPILLSSVSLIYGLAAVKV